jgi:hypothetical protein
MRLQKWPHGATASSRGALDWLGAGPTWQNYWYFDVNVTARVVTSERLTRETVNETLCHGLGIPCVWPLIESAKKQQSV